MVHPHRALWAFGYLILLGLSWLFCATAGYAAEGLKLERVMLSSAGVGYFEYQATVDGTEELALTVPLEQVDDVLKSIVVFDDVGGAGSVTLPGRQPLEQVFRDLPFGPEALASPAALLNHLRGEDIRITGTNQMEGRLLGVVAEVTQLPDGLGSVTRHRVSLITDGGLKQFVLEETDSLAFLDAELTTAINEALATMASHRAQDRRSLLIEAVGTGPRTLTVGYVIGAPLWKSSYRAALASGEERARLQGWAMVDNMSGQDWEGVELTLVSGNPVTFRQALYEAYYVERPEVPVEVLGRILPRRDTGAFGGEAGMEAQLLMKSESEAAYYEADVMAESELRAGEPMASFEAFGMVADAPRPLLAAAAREAATQVVYRLPDPVSVPHGHALLVPIIDRKVPAERVALYQPGTHERHPLATVRLVNDTETGLPPGVLTLYEVSPIEGIAYVGDAQLGTLPAGEERLVSFALDQKTRIDREAKGLQRIAKGKINHGLLELTLIDEQTTTYRVKAPAREKRAILIEQARQPGWTLARPPEDEVEITEDAYRILLAVEAGAEGTLEVTLEMPRLQSLQLISMSTEQFVFYGKTGELDEPLRQAFRKMAELKGEMDRHQHRLNELVQQRQRIFEEQARIRENLVRVPQNSDIHKRYLTKLNAQEDELEKILFAMEDAQDALNRASEALSDYIGRLEL
jgi:hypothetical protein